jgi:hypothetical protein
MKSLPKKPRNARSGDNPNKKNTFFPMVRLQKFQIQQKQNSNKTAKHEKKGEGTQHREEETKTQNQNHKVTKEQFELV